MVNYKYSKIYKITSPNVDKCFINSTTKKYLSQRMTYYVDQYNLYKVGKTNFKNKQILELFKLFDTYNINSFKIILLEAKELKTHDELTALLHKYIK